VAENILLRFRPDENGDFKKRIGVVVVFQYFLSIFLSFWYTQEN